MRLLPIALAVAALAAPAHADPPAGPVASAIPDTAVLATLEEPDARDRSLVVTYSLYGADYNAGLVSTRVRTLCSDRSCIRNLERDTQGAEFNGWWAVVRRGRGQPPYYLSRDSLTAIPAGFTLRNESGQLVASSSTASGEQTRQQIIRFSPTGTTHGQAVFTLTQGSSPTLVSATIRGASVLPDLLAQPRIQGVRAAMQGTQVTITGRDAALTLLAAAQQFLGTAGNSITLQFERGADDDTIVARMNFMQTVEGRSVNRGYVRFNVSVPPGKATLNADDSSLPTGWTRRTGDG